VEDEEEKEERVVIFSYFEDLV